MPEGKSKSVMEEEEEEGRARWTGDAVGEGFPHGKRTAAHKGAGCLRTRLLESQWQASHPLNKAIVFMGSGYCE